MNRNIYLSLCFVCLFLPVTHSGERVDICTTVDLCYDKINTKLKLEPNLELSVLIKNDSNDIIYLDSRDLGLSNTKYDNNPVSIRCKIGSVSNIAPISDYVSSAKYAISIRPEKGLNYKLSLLKLFRFPKEFEKCHIFLSMTLRDPMSGKHYLISATPIKLSTRQK